MCECVVCLGCCRPFVVTNGQHQVDALPSGARRPVYCPACLNHRCGFQYICAAMHEIHPCLPFPYYGAMQVTGHCPQAPYRLSLFATHIPQYY